MIMDETREFDLDAPGAASGDWSDYVLGVAVSRREQRRHTTLPLPVAADLIVWSDVPIGVAFSPGAALEVSVAHALLTQSDQPFDP